MVQRKPPTAGIVLSWVCMLAALAASCQPVRPPSTLWSRSASPTDAGHPSWARQMVPKLLGRKARGYAEVKVLADLAAESDRPTVLKATLMQPALRREYVDHWSETLVRFLRVHRMTAKDQTTDLGFPGLPESPESARGCFGTGYVDEDSATLATFVRDHDPLTEVAPPHSHFNMTDLLRSALVLDDLSPVYRGYLFAMVHKPLQGDEATPQNMRDDLGATFTQVYTHRQMLCLTCHSTTASVTGPGSRWNRHFPIRGRFAEALFGAAWGRASDEVHALLRVDVNCATGEGTSPAGAALTCSEPLQPWRMQDCGSFVHPDHMPEDPLRSPGSRPDGAIDAFFIRAHGSRAGVFTLERELHAGLQTLAESGLQRDKDARVDGQAAFAYLTATRVVESTWEEVFGAPLTIAHHFPRNQAQRDILQFLTEVVFVQAHWSLQALLTQLLASDDFSRPAPADARAPGPYQVPPYLDPWIAADPRLPPVARPGTPPGSNLAPTPSPTYDPSAERNRPRHYNSVGDGVHRYSPRSLLYAVHRALGWPAPARASSVNYPDDSLRKAIGQFYRDAEPGFGELSFQSLLAWEDVYAGCENKRAQGDDWIGRLLAEIEIFNRDHPHAPATLRDAAIAVKDRILADPSLSTSTHPGATDSEVALVRALFRAPLTTVADPSLGHNELEHQLRAFCGVLLQSPQFLLAGIAPRALGERPRLLACLPGEPCSYQQLCESHQAAFSELGYALTCRDDTLALSTRAAPPTDARPRVSMPPPEPPLYSPLLPTVAPFNVDRALERTRNAYWLNAGEAGLPTVPGQVKQRSGQARRAVRAPKAPRLPLRTPATSAFDAASRAPQPQP